MTDKIDALFEKQYGPRPDYNDYSWLQNQADFRAGYTAHAKSLDPSEMREMLRAMQHGEMTVSRGVELLDMWLAGNYNDEQLPPIRDGLGEDEMPWDRIDKLWTCLHVAQFLLAKAGISDTRIDAALAATAKEK